MKTEETEFELELEALLNKHSQENKSNTPDFILMYYIKGCLESFNKAVNRREEWYGRQERDNDLTDKVGIVGK